MIHENLVKITPANGAPLDFMFDYNEICDIKWAANYLSLVAEETLLYAYQQSFGGNSVCTYLQNWAIGSRIFGTIMPKYRNKPPLNHNLNDTQIVLALCYASTGTNCSVPGRQHFCFTLRQFYYGYQHLPYTTLAMVPISFSQSRHATSHIIKHIQFGGTQYYHPDQRVMTPPLWISVCPYKISIKQLTKNELLEAM